jgi:apolipoprotein N-acyltransferase
MAVHPSRTVVAVGEVSPHADGHRWARTGPARPVDNEGGLAADEVILGPKERAGPVEPPGPGYAAEVDDRLAPLPMPAALVLAALGGLALDLSFPDTGWWPLAAVGIALLVLAARGARARRGALLGLVTGLACFVPLLAWSGIYVGALPWLALAASQAAFVALIGAALPAAWRAPFGTAGTVAAVTGLWVLQEGLRARLPFGGFPWGRVAFSQAGSPSAGWAALGGAPAVSAVVAAAGACLAVAVVRGITPYRAGTRRGPRALAAPAVLATLVAAVALPAAGPLALRAGQAGEPAGERTAQVAAVQGNVPQAGLDFNAQRRAVLDNHVRATLALADDVRAGRVPAPDLVVWPENSSDIDPLVNRDAYAEISDATARMGVPMLVGAVLQGPGEYVSNAGIVWAPATGPADIYIKRHPVPFAEYIPYRSFFRHFSDKVDLVSRDFAPGHAVGVLPLGPAKVGDVICFEVAYDDLVRDTVRAGADLLVVQTNNATFGYSAESTQQLAMSRLRAVESGRAVVQISTVGVSGLIAPDGTLVDRSGLFTTDVLVGRLPLRTGLTVATRAGAAPEIALAALGCILVAAAGLRRRRAAGAPRAAAPLPATGGPGRAEKGEPVAAGEQTGAQR